MYQLQSGASIGPYPYKIMRRLENSAGGMSDVYLASVNKPFQARQEASTVVIKIAHTENIKSNNDGIRNEEERLPQLTHSGIVKILPIWAEDRTQHLGYRSKAVVPGMPLFCVFEYIQGCSLAQRIHKPTWQLSIGYTLKMLIDIAHTLEYLHAKKLVHMDVKPSNILLRKRSLSGRAALRFPSPILIDFGITRRINQKTHGGTEAYMAPERLIKEGDVRAHPSMDAYSLGVIMQKVFINRRRSGSDNNIIALIDQVMESMLDEDWQVRPDMPAFIRELVQIQGKLKPYHWI